MLLSGIRVCDTSLSRYSQQIRVPAQCSTLLQFILQKLESAYLFTDLHEYTRRCAELFQRVEAHQNATTSDCTAEAHHVIQFLGDLFEYVGALPRSSIDRSIISLSLIFSICNNDRSRFLKPYHTVTLHEAVYCGASANATSHSMIANLANVRRCIE